MLRMRRITAAVALAVAPAFLPAHATIYGTMSNFDVFNDTSVNVYGAELELEGVHSLDVMSTYPSHFNNKSITEYLNPDSSFGGTRVRFTGYNFNASGFIAPTVGQSTNGHLCVNLPGCEHFGFSVNAQPTATRYFWLDQNEQRVGNMPMSVPTPSWTYIPPPPNKPADPVVLIAEIKVPEPAEVHALLPDSVWMKVYVTEVKRPVALNELLSGKNGVVPEDEAETESEWELLEGGAQPLEHGGEIGDDSKSVVRRYEFYKYTGDYSSEHEPLSDFVNGGLLEPPAGELGPFIAANMVAANLAPIPEPETYAMMLVGLGITGWVVHRRRRA